MLSIFPLLLLVGYPCQRGLSPNPDEPREAEDGRSASTRVWHDLRDVLAATQESLDDTVDMRTHLEAARIDQLEPESYAMLGGAATTLDLDDIVTHVKLAMGAVEGARVQKVDIHAGHLVLDANRRAHDVTGRTLDVLRRATRERVAVDVHRLTGAQVPPDLGSHLNPEAAAALALATPGSLVARETVRTGRPVRLTDAEWSTYLSDYDVEAAQFAGAADPIVARLASGIEVAVQVDRAADGRRYVVRTWGRDGSLEGAPRTRAIECLGTAQIELPKMRTSLWASSAILEPGGAIVIAHSAGEEPALMVRVATDGQEPIDDPDIVNLGELGLPPMRLGIPFLSAAAPSGGQAAADSMGDFFAAPWKNDPLPWMFSTENVAQAVRSGAGTLYGSRLLAFDSTFPTSPIRAGLESLRQELRIGTIEVDVRFGYIPRAELSQRLEDGGLTALAATAKNRMLGSVMENDALLLVGGSESAYLMDFDIQVAHSVVVGDPIVSSVFEGVALWCAPLRAADGKIFSWFDIRAQRSNAELRSIPTVISTPVASESELENGEGLAPPAMQRIELPVTHPVNIRARVEAERGEWVLLAARRVADSDEAFVAVARMQIR